MQKVVEIIKQRILLAEKKKGEATTPEMESFWDGQLRCAQALLNEVAHLTRRGADSCPECGFIKGHHRIGCSKAVPKKWGGSR